MTSSEKYNRKSKVLQVVNKIKFYWKSRIKEIVPKKTGHITNTKPFFAQVLHYPNTVNMLHKKIEKKKFSFQNVGKKIILNKRQATGLQVLYLKLNRGLGRKIET